MGGCRTAAFYRQPLDWLVRDAEVIEALNELVETHPRWGFWKYIDRLRALGHRWNHQRIYRVYCGLALNQPRRTRRKLPERARAPLFVPERPDQVWSADFMSDALYYGTRFRTFNVIDDYKPRGLGHRGGHLAARAACGAGAGEAERAAGCTGRNPGRQRT